jgi:hypothetical protein
MLFSGPWLYTENDMPFRWRQQCGRLVRMASLEGQIDRILAEVGALTAVEITLRLNAELSSNPYTITEVVACANRMPNLLRSGKEYCRKP